MGHPTIYKCFSMLRSIPNNDSKQGDATKAISRWDGEEEPDSSWNQERLSTILCNCIEAG
jgi:hypothetical protein